MIYVGMAEEMEFMRVRQPTKERFFAFQLANLSRNLSIMGTPRYLPNPEKSEYRAHFPYFLCWWGRCEGKRKLLIWRGRFFNMRFCKRCPRLS